MRLELDLHLADGYKSPAQRARRVTEGWLEGNMYCPACPSERLAKTRDNTRVVDFVCSACKAEYQLKAKGGPLGAKLRDAAYAPMMERALSNESPHFLFLGYDKRLWRVMSLLLVPGQFITPSVIERCKPLSVTARRKGWVGCNILAHRIPEDGRLLAVAEGRAMPPESVREGWRRFQWAGELDVESKGWLFDVLRCVRSFGGREFTSKEIYAFSKELGRLHPKNLHVDDKIRQQLQQLRNKGIVRFLNRGRYVAV